MTAFARHLIPTEEEIKNGKEIADQIFRAIQSKSRFRIDRTRILGSIEKKTSLRNDADIDLVIYVNDIEIPFDKVLKDFTDILELHESLNVKIC